jgi:hypothetical protein
VFGTGCGPNDEDQVEGPLGLVLEFPSDSGTSYMFLRGLVPFRDQLVAGMRERGFKLGVA